MNRHIITIVPLGPDDAQMLTLGALETLRRAQHLVLRTQRHGVAELLKREGIAFETFDPLYEQCEDFDELCAQIADRLIALAREGGALCYAVSEPASDATARFSPCIAGEYSAQRVGRRDAGRQCRVCGAGLRGEYGEPAGGDGAFHTADARSGG